MLGIHGDREGPGRLLPVRPRPRASCRPDRATGPGRASEGLGLGRPGPDRGIPAASGRPAPALGRRARNGPDVRGGIRPHVQRAQVGQRRLRLGGHRRGARTVVDAHADAVAGSLSYLERHAITATRRSGPARVVLPTSGALAAVFTHGVSRNGDPHIHSHVVLANLVHGEDGRWGACDRRGIAAHRIAASAVYEAHLRAGLTAALGLGWTGSPGRSTEVAGVGTGAPGGVLEPGRGHPPPHDEWGVHSGRGARIAWAATRPAKEPGTPFGELAARWQRQARAVGGDLEFEPGPYPWSPRPARRASLRRRDRTPRPRWGPSA